VKCPHCETELVNAGNPPVCPTCGTAFADKSIQSGESDSVHAETLKESFRSPKEFFARMPKTGGLLNPLLYGLILETLGGLIGYLWSLVFGSPFHSNLREAGISAVAIGIAIPFLVFFSILVWAAVLHVSLLLVGGAKEDFESTLRVVCYSASPEILAVIPVLGGLIKFFWKFYINVVGLREVHSITTAKSVTAVILPAVICCGIPFLGLFIALLIV
jgi:hypothetical protein